MERCLDFARHDRRMDAQLYLYLLVGLIIGAAVAGCFFFLTRRNRSGEIELLQRLELLDRAQERAERMLREEMSRGREENAAAAKAQREELTSSLESVRAIVDSRLQAVAGGQFAADRQDARDGGREVAGHTRETARRIVQAGERSARAGASGTWRDAATRERRRRPAKSSEQRENARRLGRSATRRAARTGADAGTIRAQREHATGKRRARRFRDQTSRR